MKFELKKKALEMRKRGLPYSEIRLLLKVSKSTLSVWLREHPLSSSQINTLRGNSSKRIEKFRNTMKIKRNIKIKIAEDQAKRMIGTLSARDKFLGGIFLYWAEGYKTADTTTALANTDPEMIRFFIDWLANIGIKRKDMRVRLQLYADMNIDREMLYWKKVTGLPSASFRTPYIKESLLSAITHKKGFGHGTCNILYHNRPINDLVLSMIQKIRHNSKDLS